MPRRRRASAQSCPDPAKLTSGFHVLTANFVGLLFDKNRAEVLRGLGHAFKLKVLASRGAVEGQHLQLEDAAFRALRDDEAVRSRYQAQFAHIFVDEFQDVNAVQREIMKLQEAQS